VYRPFAGGLSGSNQRLSVRSSLRAGLIREGHGALCPQFRDDLRYERRVELAFEEHRFYDVRRWKIAAQTENAPAYGVEITKNGNTSTYARKEALSGRRFEEKHYWLPIPQSEILSSNGRLEQNPEY